MVELTVFSMKDIAKYLVKVTLVITIIVTFTRFFYILKDKDNENIINKEIVIYAVNRVIPGLKIFSEKDKVKIERNSNNYKIVLNSELNIVKTVSSRNLEKKRFENETTEISNNQNQQENVINEQEGQLGENDNVELQASEQAGIIDIQTGVPTEVLENTYNGYSFEIQGVKVKNESSHQINASEYNLQDITVNKNNILIFHTHTCESYTASQNYQYNPTGNYRTTDLNFTVARVGDELEKYLKSFNFNVIHDKTYHDYPAYSGSYGRSLNTVEKLLKDSPNTEVVIDLHRDAIGDNTYAPKVKIGEEIGAQLMFVIGTDGSGLAHENWKENFEFALQVQKKANELYPGLFKPMLLRNSRYNQQVANGACIIEVGATGNTMDECLVSMKYLSKVLEECK